MTTHNPLTPADLDVIRYRDGRRDSAACFIAGADDRHSLLAHIDALETRYTRLSIASMVSSDVLVLQERVRELEGALTKIEESYDAVTMADIARAALAGDAGKGRNDA